MPRQLPWKVEPRATTGLGPKKTPSRSQSVASPAPSSRRLTPRLKSETESGRKGRLGRKSGRSPSTSPPPEPLEEEPMHPGLTHDDRYRMVEDEFLFIAGIFTRHLHAAEYQRLKTLAAARSQQADPNTTIDSAGGELVKRRNAALDTAARQQGGVARSLARRGGGGGGGEERVVGLTRRESSLQGLMESPRKQKVPLTGLVGGSRAGSSRAGSRPGSGYRGTIAAESPSRRRPGSGYGYAGRGVKREVEREREMEPVTESEEDEDDGDLDGQPVWPRKPDSRQAPMRRTTDPGTKRPEKEEENPFKRVKTAPLPALARESPAKVQAAVYRGKNHEEEDHKEGEEGEEEDEDFFTRLRARRAEQRRRREPKVTDRDNIKTENAQAASLNSIPFM
ncbi:hypothetical protein B0J18DRAFT_472954 [Chaetomium sp. MPI-SDFR-AT-0129]|nr:hypothetical protein B0J18DRAFT_472954 [Chaetomium sp. MPI-SDFR-AT-0129]